MAIPAIEAVHLNSFRDRMMSLIRLPAALKIDFEVDHIRFTGYVAFPAITARLASAMDEGPGLKISSGRRLEWDQRRLWSHHRLLLLLLLVLRLLKPLSCQAIIHEAAHAGLISWRRYGARGRGGGDAAG